MFNRFLNASDWIRYGILAVLLTTVFYVLVRQPLPSNFSSNEVQPPNGKVAALNPPLRSRPETHIPLARRQPMKPLISAPNSPTEQVASKPSGDSKQTDGRAAVCAAARTALPNFRAGKLSGRQAVRLAHETYRSAGGPQSPHEAVHDALTEYDAGAWSEADCPPGLPLPKGTIGEIMGLRKGS